jgi:hypothetical protein
MKTKIALTLGAFGTALAMLPMFAAFEAHVINVTAQIENALEVPLEHMDFGTVFPQEYLVKNLPISLSQSFMDEGRVDDVEYIIRQKPKCGLTTDDGRELIGPTATGHVVVDPQTGEVRVDCGPHPTDADGQQLPGTWGQLPLLCPYLSKHEVSEDGSETENDGSLDAFHKPWTVLPDGSIVWNDVEGRLTKLAGDFRDLWEIDLAVPCFGDHCAQDWAEFVEKYHPGEGDNADMWVQDIANEHKVFGCDLWVEVTEVSETR